MAKYKILTLSGFDRDLKKFRHNLKIQKRITSSLKILQEDPFNPTLKTHFVNLLSTGQVWSSRVSGDIRLLWVFDSKQSMIIIAIRLQGHDTVYK